MKPRTRKATIAAAALALITALVAPPPAPADQGGAARTRSGGSTSGGRDGHRGSHRVGRIGVGVHFGHGYYSPYRPYWGYGYGWGPYPGYYVSGRGGESPGAFDLNIKPKKAEVYLDGAYVGTAGKMDGYPSYLWVNRGEHELIFYLPGFETVVRRVTAIPGGVIDLSFEMIEGESRTAEEVTTLRAADADNAAYDLRQSDSPEGVRAPVDARAEPGRLMVAVAPADASVYLDGRFLGTARELAGLHAGLMVDAGSHRLEVVRPGYASQSRDFSVDAGQEIDVDVSLDEM
jgi:hypothetical protein